MVRRFRARERQLAYKRKILQTAELHLCLNCPARISRYMSRYQVWITLETKNIDYRISRYMSPCQVSNISVHVPVPSIEYLGNEEYRISRYMSRCQVPNISVHVLVPSIEYLGTCPGVISWKRRISNISVLRCRRATGLGPNDA